MEGRVVLMDGVGVGTEELTGTGGEGGGGGTRGGGLLERSWKRENGGTRGCKSH